MADRENVPQQSNQKMAKPLFPSPEKKSSSAKRPAAQVKKLTFSFILLLTAIFLFTLVAVMGFMRSMVFVGQAGEALPPERISRFASLITVDRFQNITVREEITFEIDPSLPLDQRVLKRGFCRVLPTEFKNDPNTPLQPELKVERAMINGKEIAITDPNNPEVCFGDKDPNAQLLPAGKHFFAIDYSLKQIFTQRPDYNELVLNLFGAAPLPVTAAVVELAVPRSPISERIEIEGWFAGSKIITQDGKEKNPPAVRFKAEELPPSSDGKYRQIRITAPRGVIAQEAVFMRLKLPLGTMAFSR